MTPDQPSREVCLEIYADRSVFVASDGHRQVFAEGAPSSEAKLRQRGILSALQQGYIDEQIEVCRAPSSGLNDPDEAAMHLLSRMVDSVTAGHGRAIVGLTVLQLAIKSIEPAQSVRLHKGGGRTDDFSWVDGISMRNLDRQFNTPALRRHGLLNLNADGCFMTRSLAENYPYTPLYKAALRGAREEWLELIDRVEFGRSDPSACLRYLLGLLANRSESFRRDADAALAHVLSLLPEVHSIDLVSAALLSYCAASSHAARVFEIAMHSLCQVVEHHHGYDGALKPLSQMRSANKKHGNIGDVEVLERTGGLRIQLSWDAKYGKPYLRDELDELDEKLQDHPEALLVGFVTDGPPDLRPEILDRVEELKASQKVQVEIVEFSDWAKAQAARVSVSSDVLAREWLVAFAETICQRRRSIAPVDEPADSWVKGLAVLRLADRRSQ